MSQVETHPLLLWRRPGAREPGGTVRGPGSRDQAGEPEEAHTKGYNVTNLSHAKGVQTPHPRK